MLYKSNTDNAFMYDCVFFMPFKMQIINNVYTKIHKKVYMLLSTTSLHIEAGSRTPVSTFAYVVHCTVSGPHYMPYAQHQNRMWYFGYYDHINIRSHWDVRYCMFSVSACVCCWCTPLCVYAHLCLSVCSNIVPVTV